MVRTSLFLILALVSSVVFAQEAGVGSNRAGESIADAIRANLNADIAFVPAAMIKSGVAGDNLSDFIAFPEETVVVATLTGKQVLQALEKSLGLFPINNPGFLQVSGLSVTFNPRSPIDERVSSVTVNDAPIDLATKYRVAMPSNLLRGGLGYFQIWSVEAQERGSREIKLIEVLKGKKIQPHTPRWIAQGNN